MDPVLAIDTAAARLQLALMVGGTVETLAQDMASGQAERLFPALAELMARRHAAYAGLARVAVVTGPGSFTGIRIGLAAARGLGLALGIPVLGVPTLLAHSLTAGGGALWLDARRDEVYCQRFAGPGKPLDTPLLLNRAEAERRAAPHAAIELPHFIDIAALALFAATADPAAFPPDPTYGRGADARPQEKFRVARAPS